MRVQPSELLPSIEFLPVPAQVMGRWRGRGRLPRRVLAVSDPFDPLVVDEGLIHDRAEVGRRGSIPGLLHRFGDLRDIQRLTGQKLYEGVGQFALIPWSNAGAAPSSHAQISEFVVYRPHLLDERCTLPHERLAAASPASLTTAEFPLKIDQTH